MGASRPRESATDGQARGSGPTGPSDHRSASGASAGRGVTLGFRSHCEEVGGANMASVLGGTGPVQSLLVVAAEDATMDTSGARAQVRDAWAAGGPPGGHESAVGFSEPSPVVTAARQAWIESGFFVLVLRRRPLQVQWANRVRTRPLLYPACQRIFPTGCQMCEFKPPVPSLSQLLIRGGVSGDGMLPRLYRCAACGTAGRRTFRIWPSSGRPLNQQPWRTAG